MKKFKLKILIFVEVILRRKLIDPLVPITELNLHQFYFNTSLPISPAHKSH